MTEPIADPGPSTPDDADWTWVLTRPCPDCGFDAAAVAPGDVPAILRDAGQRFAVRLAHDDARTRPDEGAGPPLETAPPARRDGGGWSPLESACHARDVCDVMRGRLEQILAGGGELVAFADWDQDR